MYLGLMMLKTNDAATPIFKYSSDPYLTWEYHTIPIFSYFPILGDPSLSKLLFIPSLPHPTGSAWQSSTGERRGIKNLEAYS